MLCCLGSTHCSEVRYVLGKGIFSKFKPNHDDLKMLDIMTAYFTNFAKYGYLLLFIYERNVPMEAEHSGNVYPPCRNPSGDGSSSDKQPIWELYDPKQPYRHLHIQLPTPVMADDYQKRRMELWEKVLQKNRSRARL
ncbi:hypothetical protein TELCIR_12493 [Teladorsagia circumcincta]|uniref:Carboxylesterase type B domain-containing protein n=1 Tax=Teladorsagia circumcincta TaxID=45464 RepID=A0A2G9U6C7_TELCI|nr:hypothetical protein TELCIR_12493 [Teladorsagia circumcincta]